MIQFIKFTNYCAQAHAGEKYGSEPYFNHCVRVADILFKYDIVDDASVCIALGHDLLEDTLIDSYELRATLKSFGFAERVREIVVESIETLTNKFTHRNYPSYKRGDRAGMYLNYLIPRLTPLVCNVKCADIIDNVSSIVEYDPDFAQLYIPEKLGILGMISMGNPELYQHAINLCTSKMNELCAK